MSRRGGGPFWPCPAAPLGLPSADSKGDGLYAHSPTGQHCLQRHGPGAGISGPSAHVLPRDLLLGHDRLCPSPRRSICLRAPLCSAGLSAAPTATGSHTCSADRLRRSRRSWQRRASSLSSCGKSAARCRCGRRSNDVGRHGRAGCGGRLSTVLDRWCGHGRRHHAGQHDRRERPDAPVPARSVSQVPEPDPGTRLQPLAAATGAPCCS